MKTIKNLFILSLLSFAFACGGGDAQKEETEKSDEKKEESNTSDESTGNTAVDKAIANAEKRKEERKKKGDTLAMNYKDLQKYLPKSIKGYELDGEMKGQSLNMGGFSYSIAEAEYKKGDDRVKLALHDYNAAYQMYAGLTAIWASGMSIENDEEKANSVTIKNGIKGWEVYKKKSKEVNLFLGVNDRFYITVNAENQAGTDFAKSIAESVNLTALSEK